MAAGYWILLLHLSQWKPAKSGLTISRGQYKSYYSHPDSLCLVTTNEYKEKTRKKKKQESLCLRSSVVSSQNLVLPRGRLCAVESVAFFRIYTTRCPYHRQCQRWTMITSKLFRCWVLVLIIPPEFHHPEKISNMWGLSITWRQRQTR